MGPDRFFRGLNFQRALDESPPIFWQPLKLRYTCIVVVCLQTRDFPSVIKSGRLYNRAFRLADNTFCGQVHIARLAARYARFSQFFSRIFTLSFLDAVLDA